MNRDPTLTMTSSSSHQLIPSWLRFMITVFLSGLVISTAFRVLFLLLNTHLLDAEAIPLISDAFLKGIPFDIRVITAWMAIPFLVLSFCWITDLEHAVITRITTVFMMIGYGLVIATSLADPPYFDYYGSRISKDILMWTDKPGVMLKVLFGDLSFLPWLAAGLVLISAYGWWLIRLEKWAYSIPTLPVSWKVKTPVFILPLLVLFLGLRGNAELKGKPAITSEAFFSEVTFINQLTINPFFNLIDSFTMFRLEYADNETVIRLTREHLGITDHYKSPVARYVEASPSGPKRKNVVLFLMESQSAYKTSWYGKAPGLTPFLDSLAAVSRFYPNTFTTGVHTRNGIYGTITGLPTVMGIRPMQSSIGNGIPYGGLPLVLKNHGYQTIFFCTGDKEFDNMGGFLSYNGYDRVIDQDDYPTAKRFNKWGVTDAGMFTDAVPVLNELHEKGKPFFATFLTISGHEKTDVAMPEGFHPTADQVEDQRFQLADWSIGQFFKMAGQQSWYDSTLFVLIADHGYKTHMIYDLSVAYVQSPLIFFDPAEPEIIIDRKLSLQIDVFPTLMGLLNLPYMNNSLGIDLRKEVRPFAYFSNGTNIGVVDSVYYLMISASGAEFLYRYQEGSTENHLSGHPDLVQRMKNYALPMLQTSQWLVENRHAGLIPRP